MTYSADSRIVSIALPLLFGMAYTTLAGAQVRPMTRDSTPIPPGAMAMANGAATMMSGPHHALAMAYGESLATFARAVNVGASQSHTVNVELARPATLEMRRSFEQMKVHHAAQMAPTGVAMRMPMTADSAAGTTRPARRDSMTKPMTMPMPARGRRDSARVKPMTPPMRSDSTMSHPMTMPMAMDSSRMAGMGAMQAHMATIETHLAMLEAEVSAPAPDTAKVIEHTGEILKICAAMMPMPSGQMGKPNSP